MEQVSFRTYLEAVAELQSQNVTVEKGDYLGDDGLIYCGKCHTRKQGKYDFDGQILTIMCLCKCADEEYKKKREELERRDRAETNKLHCFPSSEMLTWTFENDDMSNEPLTTAMRNYAEHFEEMKKRGKGLFLWGTCGTGKTYAACEVASAVLEMGYAVLFTDFRRLLNSIIKSNDKQAPIDSLREYDLVVLDDLGVERETQFAQEQVESIVDTIEKNNIPVVITTNLTIDQVKNPQTIEYKRIYERILKRCHPIEVKGQNRRRKEAKDDYDEMRSLLGL